MNAASAVEIPLPAAGPPTIVATAAPRDAPALTPMICGSARGLRKMLCICAPDRANAAPASSAVTVLGALNRDMISKSALPPQKRSAMTMTARMQIPEMHAMVFLLDFMGANLRKSLVKIAGLSGFHYI